ncbi:MULTISPECIES: FtsW/RodA/SpoVE family cell cycle protein [Bacillales]|uniref:Probable peptidoglycan glycosyltransferase FtsW n=1 Tax=Lysinibacillus louembei TaxID=1470088 RepID=A0ABZ0RXS2_9BACI|nr:MULTISPECIES: FtsW/RodA/SpoVE family cell cycle protein [Bacillales]MCT6923972.1 FtsW/RodA/SpoVE family cell cycle protein [Metasolibacillus sp.]MCT6940170.1 FtsW/RodA/SpoVE family cell cycle protein [Metasolibacillus sp.]WPK12086.1 FtsW/RodA/SpoVE family cell cycle protein [Lysinibacillus louembei]
MKKYFATYFRNFDYPLFITYILLCLFGLVMIYSSSMMVAITEQKPPDAYYAKQLTNLKVAALAFIVGAFFPYKHYSNKTILFMLMCVMAVLLAWVNINGMSAGGSKSWISLFGIMNFQPSEYAKLFVILYFAGSLYKKGLRESSIQNVQPNDIIYPISIWLLILFSVGMETDLGAVLIIGVIAMSILAFSGIKGRTLGKFVAVLGIFGTIIIAAVFLIKGDILTESRMGRFLVLKNPFEYADGSGYQIVNGYLAIGAGGLEGRGLGQSIQKLGYLPHPETDFIMAIIAEELGVLGVAIVIGGLAFIVLRGLYIAMTTKDPLARMIAGGIAVWIGFQAFLNLAGLAGIFPLTGVTLPFISYGGTSILLLSLAMGILINISMYYKFDKRKQS